MCAIHFALNLFSYCWKTKRLNNEGVNSQGYMWGQFALVTNRSAISFYITFVLTLTIKTKLWNSKHSSNQELNESFHAWANLIGRLETSFQFFSSFHSHYKQSGHWFECLSHLHIAGLLIRMLIAFARCWFECLSHSITADHSVVSRAYCPHIKPKFSIISELLPFLVISNFCCCEDKHTAIEQSVEGISRRK